MKIKINRNNTIWLSYLGITSIISGFIFVMGLIIFLISLVYSVSNESDKARMVLSLNLISYYYSAILVILEVFACVYLFFNYYYWVLAYKKAISKRKKYNLTFVSITGPALVIMGIDSLVRLFYVVAAISVVGDYSGTTSSNEIINLAIINFAQNGAIFGNFSSGSNFLSQGNFGFNVIILLIVTGVICGTSLNFYWSQKKLFISEERENAKKAVRDNYRVIEMNKIKKKLSKHKEKDISKKIKVF